MDIRMLKSKCFLLNLLLLDPKLKFLSLVFIYLSSTALKYKKYITVDRWKSANE